MSCLVLPGPPNPALRVLPARYAIATVQRAGRGRSLPACYAQADLDLLQPAGLTGEERLLAEAELVKAVCQVRGGGGGQLLVSKSCAASHEGCES